MKSVIGQVKPEYQRMILEMIDRYLPRGKVILFQDLLMIFNKSDSERLICAIGH